MRIVVWNVARRGFAGKQSLLRRLEPDIAVISECESEIGAPPGCWAWVGSDRHQGLGVASYGDYKVSIEHHDDDEKGRWAAPVAITGPNAFFLLAIWAQRPYGESVYRVLERYRNRLTLGSAVVAGDLNQNPKLDGPGKPTYPFSRNLALINELGMVSAYHDQLGVSHGDEKVSTHYWRYNTETASVYHIDYCFVPVSWLNAINSVEVRPAAEWINHSDHVPLVVDIRLPQH